MTEHTKPLSLNAELTLPCSVTIPNRFGKSAMTEGLADANDNPTSELNQLYKTWSEGGAGNIVLEVRPNHACTHRNEDSLDLLEISGGNYEQLSLMGVEPTDTRESTRKREAYFLEYAQAIGNAAKIPLMVTGGFRNRDIMEKSVANKEIDLVGLAPLFARNPTYLNN